MKCRKLRTKDQRSDFILYVVAWVSRYIIVNACLVALGLANLVCIFVDHEEVPGFVPYGFAFITMICDGILSLVVTTRLLAKWVNAGDEF